MIYIRNNENTFSEDVCPIIHTLLEDTRGKLEKPRHFRNKIGVEPDDIILKNWLYSFH